MARNVARGFNPAYQVIIKQPGQGVEIVADMPEQFGYSTGSQYDGLGSMVSGFAGKAGSVGSGILGGDFMLKAFTKKIWRGTAHIQFALSLLFDAKSNSQQDVHETLTILAAMALPSGQSTGQHILVPPNPTRFSNGNAVTICIGETHIWDNMVIESAQPMHESKLWRGNGGQGRGYPIAGAIELQVSSDVVYSKEDLYRAAKLNPSYSSGGDSRTSSNNRTAAPLSAVQARNAANQGVA